MGHRLLKVNESIKETLSSVITAEGLKDPRVGFVTVTGRRDDAGPAARQGLRQRARRRRRSATLTMKALEKSRGFLQARVNASLHMKRTPQLQFVYDDTLDNALRIERAAEARGRGARRGAAEIPRAGESRSRADEAAAERPSDGRRRGRGVKAARRRPRRACAGACAASARVALAVHEKPDSDALGAAAGMLDLFAQLGVDGRPVRRRRTSSCRSSDVLLPRRRACAAARRRRAPRSTRSTAAASTAWRCRSTLGRTSSSTSTTTTTTRATASSRFVRGEASSTSELVCDIARALGLRPLAAGGRGPVRGHLVRHRPLPPRQHGAVHLRDGGLARRARRRRHRHVRAALRAPLARRRCGSGRAPSPAPRPSPAGARLLAALTRADYAATGAGREETEGIVDSLRGVDGVEVAALVKEQTGGARVRVSLRSDGLDVSAVAALQGGGGHKLAAGFSSDDSPEEVTAWLSSELERRLSTASS